MIKRDYYLILGISRDETPRGIREAFRKLVKRYHPDLVGPQWIRQYQEIVEAYEVLSDPEKRKYYNKGLQGVEEAEEGIHRPIMMGPLQEPEPLIPGPVSIMRDFLTIRPSADSLFDRLFRNFTGAGIRKSEQLESLTVEIVLTPDEALRGGRVPIGIPVLYPCPSCGGSGREWPFPCSQCQGRRLIEEEETIVLNIPSRVRSGTVYEIPLRGLGIHNLFLRVHIRIGMHD